MNVLTVIEFDHFISFIIKGPYHVAVQYRIEQVWRDDNGTWQIKSGAVPFHVAQLPPPKPEGDISPRLVEALAKAVRGPNVLRVLTRAKIHRQNGNRSCRS